MMQAQAEIVKNQQEQQPSKTVLLPFKSAFRSNLEKILQQLANLRPEALRGLDQEEFEQVFLIRKSADILEHHAWVARCACDSSIWERTAAAKAGRGNKDVNQIGILAAVAKHSKKVHVTPSTIYLNARIFRLLQSVQKIIILEHNLLDVLDQQGYYETALTSADPEQSLKIFAEKKLTQKRFRVTDAQRLILAEGLSKKAAIQRAVTNIKETIEPVAASISIQKTFTLSQHLQSATEAIEKIAASCPDPQFIKRFWNDWIEDLKSEFEEARNQELCDLLEMSWFQGNKREDLLAAATKVPLSEVSRIMAVFEDESLFIRIQPRDTSLQSKYQLWHRVGEPFDNSKYMPDRRKE